MKHYLHIIICTLLLMAVSTNMSAQGWPKDYSGIMLQGFYWDGFDDAQWAVLESQADDLARVFSLVWIPQSGNCGYKSMGYDDLYWFNDYNSAFGTEAQLRSMIKTFKEKGIGTIADVVINHRKNLTNWVDFPRETYKGETYEMVSTDICRNDDGGAAKKWAEENGYQVSANNDTGEDWNGIRDLDHKSENVQRCVRAYLDFLLNDLGYTGFRYDMVKGYSASYTGQYNSEAKPQFSVGECWDSSETISNWINGTKVDGVPQSAAFDFQFKYVCANAFNNGDYSKLGQKNPWGDMPLNSSSFKSGSFRQWAITFVENHDTEKRPDGSSNGPLEKDTLAANAYLLAMPGTPCVFLKHWLKYSNEIASMADVRRAAGIVNTSSYANMRSSKDYYATAVKVGDENRLVVVVGSNLEGWVPQASQYTQVLEGRHYRYYLANSLNTAWVDKASGTYRTGEMEVRLAAVTAAEGAKLVYTLDGSEPTAADTKVENGAAVVIPHGETTLKVGLLIDGKVSAVITRNYVVKNADEKDPVIIPDFCTVGEGEICAFFESPLSWSDIKCWAWDTNNNNVNYTGGSWPGQACNELGKASNGNAVWKWTYTGTFTTPPSHIIFSSNGAPQTADLPFFNGGYYTKDGFVEQVQVGIDDIFADGKAAGVRIYDLQGRRINSLTQKGLYIVNGKKYVVR